MKNIILASGAFALAAIAMVVTSGAASGSPVESRIGQRVYPNGAQRSLLVSAVSTCVPDASAPSLIADFRCRRNSKTGLIRCQIIEQRTVSDDEYIALRLRGLGQRAVSRSGASVTYPHIIPWKKAAAGCGATLASYMASAHPTEDAASVDLFVASRESEDQAKIGQPYTQVRTLVAVDKATWIDSDIAGTSGDLVGVVE